jgi:hypothetical protein
MHYATSRKVAGSRPDEVNEIFTIHLILPATLGPAVYSVSNRNEYQKQKNKNFWGGKSGRHVGLASLPSFVILLSKQDGSPYIARPHRSPRPVTGIALLYIVYNQSIISTKVLQQSKIILLNILSVINAVPTCCRNDWTCFWHSSTSILRRIFVNAKIWSGSSGYRVPFSFM